MYMQRKRKKQRQRLLVRVFGIVFVFIVASDTHANSQASRDVPSRPSYLSSTESASASASHILQLQLKLQQPPHQLIIQELERGNSLLQKYEGHDSDDDNNNNYKAAQRYGDCFRKAAKSLRTGCAAVKNHPDSERLECRVYLTCINETLTPLLH